MNSFTKHLWVVDYEFLIKNVELKRADRSSKINFEICINSKVASRSMRSHDTYNRNNLKSCPHFSHSMSGTKRDGIISKKKIIKKLVKLHLK